MSVEQLPEDCGKPRNDLAKTKNENRKAVTRHMNEKRYRVVAMGKPTEEYENVMHGVVGFEKDLVRQGTILAKLYFSVTKDEQERRFGRRKTDPLRQWKLSETDVQAPGFATKRL